MTEKHDLRETIAEEDIAEHDAAIYKMKADLFMDLAVAEHDAIREVANAEHEGSDDE